MEQNPLFLFKELANIFDNHHFKLFLVGGTVRDYLLNIPLTDMDMVTDATPEEMMNIIPDADFTFSKFGSIKYKYKGYKFDITTLRKEEAYIDSRHPNKITFVKDLNIDVLRRDLTINGLYLSKAEEVIDLVNGVSDLNNKIIKMIGKAENRIKEDPLRILRIIRFALDLDLQIEEELKNTMLDNIHLLSLLNKDKINQEIKKIKSENNDKKIKIFEYFNILDLLKVVK